MMDKTAPRRPRPAGLRTVSTSSDAIGALRAVVADEVHDLGRLARRLGAGRRTLIVGVAVLAVLALGGIAGAAEPDPGNRSALDAWTATGTAAPTVAPAASSAVAPAASASTGLPADTLGASPAFTGPNVLDLVTKGALVIVLLFVTLRVLRRVQRGGRTSGAGLLDIIETRALGPKVQIHLVAVGDRRFLVGQSAQGLVSLGELDSAELPADVSGLAGDLALDGDPTALVATPVAVSAGALATRTAAAAAAPAAPAVPARAGFRGADRISRVRDRIAGARDAASPMSTAEVSVFDEVEPSAPVDRLLAQFDDRAAVVERRLAFQPTFQSAYELADESVDEPVFESSFASAGRPVERPMDPRAAEREAADRHAADRRARLDRALAAADRAADAADRAALAADRAAGAADRAAVPGPATARPARTGFPIGFAERGDREPAPRPTPRPALRPDDRAPGRVAERQFDRPLDRYPDRPAARAPMRLGTESGAETAHRILAELDAIAAERNASGRTPAGLAAARTRDAVGAALRDLGNNGRSRTGVA